MFGCGKWSEIQMLKYIEGNLKDREAIEKHLLECGECLKEIMELNRINAAVSGMEAVPVRKSAFISVILKDGIFDRILSNSGSYKIEGLAETRRKTENRMMVEFKVDFIPAIVKVIPAGKDSFWISVESQKLKGNSIEVRKMNEKIPFYSKKSDTIEALVKGIDYGDYEISIAGELIKVGIRDKGNKQEI